MVQSLSGVWKLQDFGEGEGIQSGVNLPDYDDSAWIPVSVPGDVHSALIAAGKIEHPFENRNIEACEWVEKREWWYRLEFDAAALAEGERADLVFEGLDTFATVFLNGQEIGRTANALIPHRLNATAPLTEGKNVLAVRLGPTVPIIERLDSSRYWSAFYTPRVMVRKAAMNFGWDWGPRLVTVGVWRPVALEVSKGARIDGHWCRTYAITPDHAVLTVGAEVERIGPAKPEGLRLRATLSHDGRDYTTAAEFAGVTAEARILVTDPKLWWPSGLGEQPLHDLRIEVLDQDDNVLDTVEDRVGIRTVELLQEPDPDGSGKSFILVVNGVRVFAKGADWIPADNMIGAVPAERYHALVRLAAEGNMNILRVWGGGVYEDDAFYAACDEMGILIWQDFMFSCAAYPDGDEGFCQEVAREAAAVVKRLRNRPCIALWCGNNENDWIDDMQDGSTRTRPFFGRRLYHEIIPAALGAHDPTRPYWPSSPYGGSDHNSERAGDRHNWQVWGGQRLPHRFGVPYEGETTPSNVSFRRYAEDMCRFCSEYGIHASPPLRTLLNRTGELDYDSEDFLYRIKDPDTERKRRMMEAHIGQPTTLEQYEVFSMLVQAEGLRFAIEHYRRRKFDCAGSIIWQHNDCWPCISWAIVDYDLNPKAGWYYARRAYAPIALSLKVEGRLVHLYAVNDTLEDAPLRARLITADTVDGSTRETTVVGTALANASTCLRTLNFHELGIADPTRQCIVLREDDGKAPEHAVFLEELKDVTLSPAELKVEISAGGNTASVTVTSDALAHFVAIDVNADRPVLDDNYLTLLPAEPRTLTVRAESPVSASDIMVKCLNALK